VRDFVAYRLGESDTDELPGLARGWRAEVVGNLLNDLLSGQMSIRIRDPHSEEPLVFEPAG
jgi:ribonuclease D